MRENGQCKIRGQPEKEQTNDYFASIILQKKARVTITSVYHNLEFLLPMSNVETLFGSAGLALSND